MKLHVAFWTIINGIRFEPGDEVEVESRDQALMLIRDGLCRPAGTPEPGTTVEPAPPAKPASDDATPPAPARPGRGASKDELVAYAVDTLGMGAEHAARMTRAELATACSQA